MRRRERRQGEGPGVAIKRGGSVYGDILVIRADGNDSYGCPPWLLGGGTQGARRSGKGRKEWGEGKKQIRSDEDEEEDDEKEEEEERTRGPQGRRAGAEIRRRGGAGSGEAHRPPLWRGERDAYWRVERLYTGKDAHAHNSDRLHHPSLSLWRH